VQFEATMRAFWFFYAATDAQIERCESVEATEEGLLIEPTAKTIGYVKGLTGTAPAQVTRQFEEFRTSSLKPLHSFVHS